MIKVENIDVTGFEPAIRGMRNPMNSWDRSDSLFCSPDGCAFCKYHYEQCENSTWRYPDSDFDIGQNDLDLMRRLYKGGSEHRKYLRMITVTMDITAPLYWWKEFDTYKIGTVANSCSTMHKLDSRDLILDDFSHDKMFGQSIRILQEVIDEINHCRQLFKTFKDKQYWWQMIQLLPSSYNQRRTVMMNYETVMNIIRQRSGHKLDEWNIFVDILKDLPYVKDITK